MWYWVYFDIITCSWNIIYFTSVPSNSSFLKSSYKRYSCNAGCRVVERLVLNSSRGFIVVSWLVLSSNNIFAQKRGSDFLKRNKKTLHIHHLFLWALCSNWSSLSLLHKIVFSLPSFSFYSLYFCCLELPIFFPIC